MNASNLVILYHINLLLYSRIYKILPSVAIEKNNKGLILTYYVCIYKKYYDNK